MDTVVRMCRRVYVDGELEMTIGAIRIAFKYDNRVIRYMVLDRFCKVSSEIIVRATAVRIGPHFEWMTGHSMWRTSMQNDPDQRWRVSLRLWESSR